MKAKIASKVMPSGRDDRRMWTMGEQPITPGADGVSGRDRPARREPIPEWTGTMSAPEASAPEEIFTKVVSLNGKRYREVYVGGGYDWTFIDMIEVTPEQDQVSE
jgi:hypothetical protein